MNGCEPIRDRFSDYLDGRLTGHEMQHVAAHLENCGDCAAEWTLLRRVQTSLASLGPVKEPADLPLRIRVALSHERAQARQSRFHAFNLAWKNTIGPFLLQAGAGLASAMFLLGTVTVLVTVFAQPQRVNAMDEPLGNATAPRLVYLTPGAEGSEIDAGPVVVEAYVNGDGRVYDFRIVSGPSDAATRSQIENILVDSYFEPARFFGEPVRGLAVLSFSGVSVRG
ncbi:MAG TPA: anti-sigma factor [Terracidiphilus sp.]|nr:anti-sigma factor [Terracidiphilus sp.]